MSKPRKALQRKVLEAPPDGGWGWMVVVGAFAILFIVRGTQNSVGVLFVVLLDHFQEGAGSTAWLTTCLTSLSLCTGPFAGALSNRFGHRRVVIFGGLLSATSIFISTFATNILYLTITFGVLTGIGFGLSRVPAVAMIGRYFKKRHALASGFAAVGSGAGSFSMAPLMSLLVDTYGWRGSFMVMAGIAFNLCVGGALLRPIYLKDDGEDTASSESGKNLQESDDEAGEVDVLPQKQRVRLCSNYLSTVASHFELGLFKEGMFVTLMVCNVLVGFGLNIPTVHIIKRAVDVGVSESQAPILLSVLGFTMMIGGFAQGFIVDCLHLSKCKFFGAVLTIYGIIVLFLPLATDLVTMCSLMALMGVARGAFAALNSVVVRTIVGQSRFTVAYGISLAFVGTPQLIGPVVAGYIYDQTQDYAASFFLGGGTILAGGLIFLTAQCVWERIRKKRDVEKCADLEDESTVGATADQPKDGLYVLFDQGSGDALGSKTRTVLSKLSEDDDSDCPECAYVVDLEDGTPL